MASRTPRKAAPSKDSAAFRSTLNRALSELGAEKLGRDEWLLQTQGGAMRFVIFDDWAAARFEDVEKARTKLPKDILAEMNQHTGRWTTHFGPAANAAAANDLSTLLSTLVDEHPLKPKTAKKGAEKTGPARRNPARRNPSTGDGDTFSQIEEHAQEFVQKVDNKIAEHRRLSGSGEMHLRTSPDDLDAREIKAQHDDSIRTLGKLRAEVQDALENFEFDRLVELGAVPADLVDRHWEGVSSGLRNPAVPGRRPCGCESARTEGSTSERTYRAMEAKAQRAAASGDRAKAERHRKQAKDVLLRAHATGEVWTLPPARNPAGQIPLEECCGGPKRNPAADASFSDFDWPVIARLLEGHLWGQDSASVVVVLDKDPHAGKALTIVDEGGELGLSFGGSPVRQKVRYTSPSMRVGNVTLAYRIQSALAGQAFDEQLDLDRDMPDSNAIPPKVRELEEKVLAENTEYSRGQARATAWSIFCKHVDPTSQHCKKLRHQYFAIKGGKGSEGLGKVRVATISLSVPGAVEWAGKTIEASSKSDPWKEADAVLTDWARKLIAADHIEERDASFEIQWADGRTYSGTYELSQSDRRGADLSQHISDALQVFAGKHQPSGMPDKEYARLVRQYGDESQDFIAKYDLGPSAGDIDEVAQDMPKHGPAPVQVLIQPGKHPSAANSTKRSAKKPSRKKPAAAPSKRSALSVESSVFQAYLEKLRGVYAPKALEAEDLKKYIRVSWRAPNSPSRSVLLFVDKDTGNVHQAESWKRPKHAMTGNIFEGQ